jgi:hypothetical protein
VRRADNLATILCPFSRNLGTLTSWNTLGHSRPVTGLLSFFYIQCVRVNFSVFFITVAYDDEKNLDLSSIKVPHGIKFSIHGIYYFGGLWNSAKHQDFTIEKSEKL